MLMRGVTPDEDDWCSFDTKKHLAIVKVIEKEILNALFFCIINDAPLLFAESYLFAGLYFS